MDIHYFHEFVVLACTLNYQEAADRLYLTQSSLTRHIQKMESDLGVELFERTTRRIRLSRYGQLLLPYAEQISNLETSCQAVLTHERNLGQNVLRIGCIPTMHPYHITDIFAEFQTLNPSVHLHLEEDDSARLAERLRNGELDFAILRESEDLTDSFIRIPIAEDTLAVVLPLSHPFAHEKSISLDQLYRESFMLLDRDTLMYELCLKECRKAGFEPYVAFTSRNLESILDLVSKGMGIGLLTRQPVLKANHSNIAIVDICPAIQTRISLNYPVGRKLSASSKQLIRLFSTGKSTHSARETYASDKGG